ncbi:MAG: hypothetical protein EPO13_01790 [Actinomycetota bacterium]|nr:MAG: hypothetical protein EPO13_01790 [Actinomycetota bacterium]
MDVHDKLDELAALVEEAKAMPFSASCVVNRAEALRLVEDIRGLLPDSLRHADLLLSDREAIVEEGREEADRLLAAAQQEQARLVSEHEVYRTAVSEAEDLRADVDAECARMRREVDDYVDAKLANFEVALNKTLAAVERGRDRIRGRAAYDELATHDDATPLPG